MTPISKHSEDQNMTKDIRLKGNQRGTKGSAEINISLHTHKYTFHCTHWTFHSEGRVTTA